MQKKNKLRIKNLREEHGLTEPQLAQYLGIDYSLIAEMEHGTRNLNVTQIEKLCSLFGCTADYLIGESDEYILPNCAHRVSETKILDLNSIAAVNKIVMNIRNMNEMMGTN